MPPITNMTKQHFTRCSVARAERELRAAREEDRKVALDKTWERMCEDEMRKYPRGVSQLLKRASAKRRLRLAWKAVSERAKAKVRAEFVWGGWEAGRKEKIEKMVRGLVEKKGVVFL